MTDKKNKAKTMDAEGGVSVMWRNLRVKVDIKKQHIFRSATHTIKELIHNVNGYVEPNSLVAVMGASGSGKSTLMSVLANRQSRDFKVNGDIRLNGQKIPPELMKRISGFVYQDDLFVPTLTVSEHLHLAARIKLDKKTTIKHRKELVDEILTDVGLKNCENRFIGNSNDEEGKLNLSGGERKRLSVATELLMNPALLFCDEPTTGLDSFTALKLMTIMRNMTSQGGKTIICSIHQPSVKIFDLFHQIILLHKGKVAFCGTTENALEFFQSIGYFYNKQQNPADYLVKSLSIVPGREVETADEATQVCLKFEESHYAKYVHERIESESRHRIENLGGLQNIDHISWFHKCYLIIYREAISTIRDPSILYFNFIRQMLLAVLLAFCIKRTIFMNQETIQSIKGILFLIMNENSITPIYVTKGYFPKKMPMFLREYSNNMNTPLIFYLSNIITLIPGFLFQPTLFTAVFYTLSQQRNTWITFLITLAANVLLFNISALFGILISLATNSPAIVESCILIMKTLSYPFSGMVMRISSIPVIFRWIRYISWVTYAFECLLIAYFEGVGYIQCSKSPEVPCLRNGQEVLKFMDIDGENLRRNIISMCCIYVIFHLLSFIALRIRLSLRMNG
ncbi:protein scarlet-like [Planococcus citri]|uniref:protein scarlet-like n=1 Tax=Planococcus citri TaxID=170843 RepID=UPI0031F772E5